MSAPAWTAALALALAAGLPAPARAAPSARPASYGEEPAATPTSLEARALRAARARVPKPPATSPGLVLAARELAARAAAGAPDPIGRAAVRGALARAHLADGAPSALLAKGPAAQAAELVAGAFRRVEATHLGAGAVERDGVTWIVLLATERHVALSPFPRDLAPGAHAVLAGSVSPPLHAPRVYVTRPSGEVLEAGGGGDRAFRVALEFPGRGRHVVEVIAEGEGGPEVAALLPVSVGGASLDGPRATPAPEPADRAASEAGVLRALNATRGRHGLAPVAAREDLAAVARRHAEAMAAAGVVAHALPGSPDAAERLRRAGIPYRKVYENVARERTALEAHAGVEESPGHLANVLRPDATAAGIGIVRAKGPAGRDSIYLAEILIAPPDDGKESPLTPDARVREALWREREKLKVAPLVADPALDDVARDAAAGMRARDDTDAEGAAQRALALRRKLAAVDVFVGTGPLDAIRSTNLKDARFRRVGVGVVTGDSARFGKGRVWIAVIYTD